VASDRSFGIFLSHPFFVWFLLWVGDDWLESTVAKPWLTLVTYLAVIVGAILVTEVFRRTPLSLPLTGRPFRQKPKNQAAAQ
jgi:peptidoglycan/LPS O-acetylase OafA/YrhL